MKHVLRTSVQALLAVLLISGAAQAQESDAELAKRLLGQWQELRMLDCEGHQQVMSLTASGSFEVKGIIHACDGKTSFTWRGKWQVQGGKFKYVTTYSEPASLYFVGETFEDEILSVTEKEWIMLEGSTGAKSTAYRVR